MNVYSLRVYKCYIALKTCFFCFPGLLRSLGRDLFNTDVVSEIISNNAKDAVVNGIPLSHVVFRCVIKPMETPDQGFHTRLENTGSQSSLRSAAEFVELSTVAKIHDRFQITYPKEPLISPQQFCILFPFHVLFNRDLLILQAGAGVQRIYRVDINTKPHLNDIFTIAHPKMLCTFDNIRSFNNSIYVLEETATLELEAQPPIQFMVDDYDTNDVAIQESIFLRGKVALKGKQFLKHIASAIACLDYLNS